MAEAKPSIADRLSPVERAKLIAKLRFLPSHPDYELMMGAIDALRDLAILVDPPFTCQGDWSCVNCYLGKRPCLAIPALASTLPEPRAGEAKGWKLVPEIPTEDMLRAMRRFQISGSQWAAALAASPIATPTRPTLTERLQQKCSDWNTYWRSPDAHGVNLSVEEATELLADALGVEVAIATPKPHPASSQIEKLELPAALERRALDFEVILARLHAAVWEAGADEDGRTDYDMAGLDEAKVICGLYRKLLAESATPKPQEGREPLTVERIREIAEQHTTTGTVDGAHLFYRVPFARAIERAHDIVPQDGDRGEGEGS